MSLGLAGSFHHRVPREPGANVRWRVKVYRRMSKSSKFAAAIREMCRRDFLFYVNGFVWQFNPRKEDGKGGKVGPFCTWPFQEEAGLWLISHIKRQRDGLIEKSRDMGASWLCLMVFEWLWHFHPFQKFLCISRNADAVDKADDPDCLFWKLDFIHRWSPTALQPRCRRTTNSFRNEENESSITGAASTGKAGVSGRATAILLDEFAHVREDNQMLDRTSDTADCRIFNSTHVGTGTAFYRLTLSGIDRMQMHWTDHPEKRKGIYRLKDGGKGEIEQLDPGYAYPADYEYDRTGLPRGGPKPGVRSPWYDLQVGRKSDARSVAQDLDIDCQGSVSQFFDPIVIRRLQAEFGSDPIWEGDYVKGEGDKWVLVAMVNGPLKLWIHPDRDGGMPAGRYAVGADPAAGTGNTPSCAAIVNHFGEKVGEYANPHIQADPFGHLCIELCKLFHRAVFIWESAGPTGSLVTKVVLETGYGPVYEQVPDEFERINVGRKRKLGWYPDNVSKPVMLDEYRRGLYGRAFVNHSLPALAETLRFFTTARGTVEHADEATGSNDPTAARTNHGDRVIADALANKAVREFLMQREKPAEKPVLDAQSMAGRRLMKQRAREREEAWS